MRVPAASDPLEECAHLWKGLHERQVVAGKNPPAQSLQVGAVAIERLRIPVHAGHRFRSMPGQRSGPCRATIPEHAGIGCEAG